MRLFITGAAILTLAAAGCGGTTATVTTPGGPTIAQVRALRYDGPKARIAVASFRNRAHGLSLDPRAPRGMAQVLQTALFQTGRFIILERQRLGGVMAEQNLGRSGRVDPRTAPPTGQLEGAEILVYATITDFSDGSGTAAGVLGAAGSVVGGILGIRKTVRLAVDFHGVDTRTGRLVFALSVEGRSSDYGVVGAGFWHGFGTGLGDWIKTPRGKALRAVINRAAIAIARRTPRRFFHYTPSVPSAYAPPPPGSVSPRY